MKKSYTYKGLIELDGSLKDFAERIKSGEIISPICPDYGFKEIVSVNKKERVHDFDSLGMETGIVYEKLIEKSTSLLKELIGRGVSYKHNLLIADIECEDKVILEKLSITNKEFVLRCKETVKKINKDLTRRGLTNSKAMLMSKYFLDNNYKFYKNIEMLKKKLNQACDIKTKQFKERSQKIRFPLHKFWFGLSKDKSYERTLDDICMYASFGYCPSINNSVILCADSEVLSMSYNLFKKVKTPVLYVSGNY
jgi:hypothetical protein